MSKSSKCGRFLKYFLSCNYWYENDKEWIDSKVKVGLSSSRKVCFICSNESPLKMMENAFLFQDV